MFMPWAGSFRRKNISGPSSRRIGAGISIKEVKFIVRIIYNIKREAEV